MLKFLVSNLFFELRAYIRAHKRISLGHTLTSERNHRLINKLIQNLKILIKVAVVTQLNLRFSTSDFVEEDPCLIACTA